MRKHFRFIKEYGSGICIFLVVAAFVGVGLQQASAVQQTEALRIARESILRSAISCYALEGNYPASYEYLKENYGLQVDEEKYSVFYNVFASNIMPDVTVVEK